MALTRARIGQPMIRGRAPRSPSPTTDPCAVSGGGMTESFSTSGWPGPLLNYSFAGSGSVDAWNFDGYVVPFWNSTNDTWEYPEMSSTGPSPSITGNTLASATPMGNSLSANGMAGSERWHAYGGEALLFLQDDGPGNASVDTLYFGPLYVDCVNLGSPYRFAGVVTDSWTISFNMTVDSMTYVTPDSFMKVNVRYWDGDGFSFDVSPYESIPLAASTAVNVVGFYDSGEFGMGSSAWIEVSIQPEWGSNGFNRFPIVNSFPARNTTLRVSNFALEVF